MDPPHLRYPRALRNSSRWIVLPCALLCNFLGSVGYTAGIIHISLLQKYRRSEDVTSWAGALLTSTFCLAGPLCGMIINTFSCRAAILVGGVLSLAGLATSSLMHTLEPLYVTYGIVTGIGQSLAYSGSIVAVGFYFQEKPTLATGGVVAGTGVGIMIFPPLVQLLISNYGLEGAFLLLGAITFQSCVFGSLIRPHSLELERQKASANKASLSVRSIFQSFTQHTSIFQNVSFIILCLSILTWSMAVSILVIYLPEFFISNGASPSDAAFLMSLFGVGNMLSRMLTGVASADTTVDDKVLFFGSYGILAVLTLLLPLYGSYSAGRVLYCVTFGLYSGGSWSLLSPMAAELVGVFHLATAFGLQMFTAGVGFLVGPVLGGLVHRHFKDFDLMFIFSGILFTSTCLFAMLMAMSSNTAIETAGHPEDFVPHNPVSDRGDKGINVMDTNDAVLEVLLESKTK